MFGRRKKVIKEQMLEILRLKRELLAEMKLRLRTDAALEETARELGKYREKKAAIDQFYNLLTFDGRPQAKGDGNGD